MKHVDIIVEALTDYRNWFVDQLGNEEELKQDEEKVKEIDTAIKYVEYGED